MRIRRRDLKQRLVEVAGGECQRCGYNKSLRALSFHRRDPEHKTFALSEAFIHAWSRLAEEILKCDLLCANCHMEIEEQNELVRFQPGASEGFD